MDISRPRINGTIAIGVITVLKPSKDPVVGKRIYLTMKHLMVFVFFGLDPDVEWGVIGLVCY